LNSKENLISSKKIPVFKLTRTERHWMNATYELLQKNVRFDHRQIWQQLDGKIKNSFRPPSIHPRLTPANGEQVRLLGIVALDKNQKILKKCNQIILCIKEILIKEPATETIERELLSEKTGISTFETGMILHLIYEYGTFWRACMYEDNNFCIRSIRVQETMISIINTGGLLAFST
jgi:hypothetical protein